MSDRWLLLFVRTGTLLSRLAPAGVRDTEGVAMTMREACEDAYRRCGRRAMIATGIMECADIVRSSLGARFDTPRLDISNGHRPSSHNPPSRRSRTLVDDLRHALRRIRASPATFVGAASMLGLAVGATTAMFTIVDALILRPVPFREPDRLVHVQQTVNDGKGVIDLATPALLHAWRLSPGFEAVHAAVQEAAVIEGSTEPVARTAARVTPGTFEMLGVHPLMGRPFQNGEGRIGTDDRVIIGEDIWRAVFAAAPDIIGRRIQVSGSSVEVVGVMPAEFHFPHWNSTVWRPIDFDAPPPAFARSFPSINARLALGVPPSDAALAATAAMQRDDPATADRGTRFQPLAAGFLDAYSTRALTALAIGVGLVFLALCANVTSLILARMTARARELAVCAALGAGRGRLLRQALLENLLLGLTGSALGLLFGGLLVGFARHYLPDAFLSRTLNPVDLDLRALGATSAAGVVAMLLAGLAPAWLSTRPHGTATMHLRERGVSASRGQRAFSRGLLVFEMALAVALLVGAGILLRSFVNLSRADRGLDADGVITGSISLPAYAFADRPTRYAYADGLDGALRQLPGIGEIALSYGMPPNAAMISFGTVKSDRPDAAGQRMSMNVSSVENSFFRVFRIPLVEGRLFEPTDTSSTVIVGAQLARALWPGGSATGHTFTLNGTDPVTVVGVVNEIRSPSSDPRDDRPEIYRPLRVVTDGQVQARAFGNGDIYFAYRCAADCPEADAVRRRIRAVSPHAIIGRIGPLDDEFIALLARPRAAAALALAFAVLATLVAAGGIFSVLSYAVLQRIREFGIRAALGANARSLGRLVLADAFRISAAGLGLGVLAAWLLSRSLTALAYGVTGADPLTWSAILSVLAATTLMASWRPARRAMRADPVTLLHEE